jgi:hypothetical protein
MKPDAVTNAKAPVREFGKKEICGIPLSWNI